MSATATATRVEQRPVKSRPFPSRPTDPAARTAPKPAAEHKILFQSFFKSVGPRTYAAQVKQAGNGNHFLVLTEGKRDEQTGEVRKTRLFVFSEDFPAFFDLVRQTASWVQQHPVPPEVAERQRKRWSNPKRFKGKRT